MNVEVRGAAEMLRRTPRVLAAMLEGVEAVWVREPYGAGTWSAHEVAAHLVYGEQTDWIARLRIIVDAGEQRAFEAFDRGGHAGLAAAHSTGELVRKFAELRERNVAELERTIRSSADLALRGRHPALGTVTAGNLIATWVVHDLNHLSQIHKAMAWQLRNEVGPWEAYLSILSAPNPR